MEGLLESTSLIRRAYWLVGLRWVAIVSLAVATFVAQRFLHVHLPATSLYAIAGILLAYNFVLYDLLRYWTRGGKEASPGRVGSIITFQISADLLILSTILHFSGGIENPFAFFFVFHMIIASILCSKLQSYLQATLAVFLFGAVASLEALGWMHHYDLVGFAGHGLYTYPVFVFGFLFVFAVTLYLVVYMTTSIVAQLRLRQEGYERANALLQERQRTCELANSQLQEKDKLKNEYVLRVTHDIKGHLAAIQSTLDVVLGGMLGPISEKNKDFVGRAHRRTIKCLEFISALLKLTRMKLTGRLAAEPFSLRDCLLNALTLTQNRARDKAITVTHRIDASIETITGEAVLIEETITNILFNAVKYTPEGGKVSLEAKDEGHTVRVTVSDSGIGIPEEAVLHIFEEFYRAENARAAERDGTGLGLAFAKQVVERHGGRIWGKNNPTDGSTFSFTLPKATSRGQ
ncbi:MAG: HAMP domain-containing histidine kinase [Sedimentisphaerales bacterium]|nr:HAMP domain-containing histidine kinase [Sedimentisphaerales bacterium]